MQFRTGSYIFWAFTLLVLVLAIMGVSANRDQAPGFIPGQRATPIRPVSGAVCLDDRPVVELAFLQGEGGQRFQSLIKQGKATLVTPGSVLEVINRSGYLTQVKILGPDAGPVNTVWVYTNALKEVALAFDAEAL